MDDAYIFISYSHKDYDRLEPVIRGLQKKYQVWYDDGIESGELWEERIARQLLGSGCVVAFISNDAVASLYCRQEITLAIHEKKPFLSVYLYEDVELTPGLKMCMSPFQALVCTAKHTADEILEKLERSELLAPCRLTGEAPPKEKKPLPPECSGPWLSKTPASTAADKTRILRAEKALASLWRK